MTHYVPTRETIFTLEHWGETPSMPKYRASGPVRRAMERIREQQFPDGKFASIEDEWAVSQALGQSALQIMHGELPKPISDGEPVGGVADASNAVPGNVLLMDTEKVILRPGIPKFADISRNIEAESDLAASPIRLIRKGFRREITRTEEPMSYFYPEPFRSVFNYFERKLGKPHEPYEEDLGDLRRSIVPEYDRYFVDTDQGVYRRTVSLVAFFEDKDGRTGSRKASSCTLWDYDTPDAWLDDAHPHEKSVVGATVNCSVREDVLVIRRLRGAYICAKGAFETATEKACSEKLNPVVRLTTQPSQS